MWIYLPRWAVWGLVALLLACAWVCLRRFRRGDDAARETEQAGDYQDIEARG